MSQSIMTAIIYGLKVDQGFPKALYLHVNWISMKLWQSKDKFTCFIMTELNIAPFSNQRFLTFFHLLQKSWRRESQISEIYFFFFFAPNTLYINENVDLLQLKLKSETMLSHQKEYVISYWTEIFNLARYILMLT